MRFLWVLFFQFLILDQLNAFEIEYKINPKNKTDEFFPLESRLNPQNIGKLDETTKNNLEINTDVKIYFNESFSATFFDTPYYKAQEGEKSDFNNQFKEAFLSFNPSRFLFLDAGRKVVKKGVGFFKNPVDFIQYPNPEDIDYSRNKSDQNRMLRGVYMGRAEIFAGSTTFSFLYSPKYKEVKQDHDQYYMNAGFKWETLDIEWIGYYGDQAKTGINFSAGLGESLEIHVEFAIQEKAKRQLIDYYGIYLTDKEKTIQYPINALIGGHITLGENSNLYLEYYFHQAGYSKSEWNNLAGKIGENQNMLISSQAYNIGVINDGITNQGGFTELQKHYGFIRYEKNKLFGDFNIAVSSVFEIQNVGALMILNPGYAFTDNFTVNLYFYQPFGTKKSESRLRYYSLVSLEIDYFF